MSHQELNSLRQSLLTELRVYRYKDSTLSEVNSTLNHLEKYMDSKGLEFYTEEVGKNFLKETHSSKDYNDLTPYQKSQVRHVNLLSQMLLTGHLCLAPRKKKVLSFNASGLEAFEEFLRFSTGKKSEKTLIVYRQFLEPLYMFLLEKRKSIKEIETPLMIQFLANLKKAKTPSICYNAIKYTRVFFRYLCEKKLLANNNIEKWLKLLSQSKNSQKKLPSTYSKEEIELIIASVARSSPKGKRDYAMIILAARTALRAQDIANLRFSNFNWEEGCIKIRQSKTKNVTKIEMDEEVEEAITDYLKNGRPEIEIPFVFITCRPPYRQISPIVVYDSVDMAIRLSGIKFEGKKHGPHALRHSMATNLLKEGATLPVIARILGHSNTQSTINYIGVDIEQLRKCALEVPLVSSTFYEGLYGKL